VDYFTSQIDTESDRSQVMSDMQELGFGGTPAIVFKGAHGTVDTFPGLPSNAQMEVLLGPK
jgi:thiol:disulfide interchange protein DsbG